MNIQNYITKWTLFLKPTIYMIFWAISIVWVFFFGFTLGQNEAPEKAVPLLSQILPKQDTQQYRGTVPVTEHELTYSTILQKPTTPVVVPNDANVVEKDKKTIQTQSQISEESIPSIVQNIEPNNQEYKFSLQLLAVKQKKSAEEYRDKLKASSITTEIVEASLNDISWYRVYTTFTGTIEQFNTFKGKLASLGIVDTILRERTIK